MMDEATTGEAAIVTSYEPPTIETLGSLTTLTLGSKSSSMADYLSGTVESGPGS